MTILEEPESAPSADERIETLERDVQKYRVSRDSWTFVIFGIAAVAVLAAVAALVVALTQDDGGGGEGGGGAEELTANLSEFTIDLSTTSISEPGVINITNIGSMVHNLGVRDTDLVSPDIPAGGSGQLDISSLGPGTYELYCEIAGHADAGMTATLTIGEAGESAGGTDAAEETHGGLSQSQAQAMDDAMIASIQAFPAETEGLGNQPLEPEILADGTKHFTLEASVIDWEVAPGQIVQAWAYNGTVPGPRIDVEVGDTVEVEITNNLPVFTDIHWHGIDVPNDQDGVAPITQDPILPGDTYTYRFTLMEPAVGMYHAHGHGDIAVPNGLFGAVFVGDMPLPAGQTISGYEIPDDVEITQNLPMVLNDAGEIGLSLDGKSFPATTPIVAQLGDWIQVTYHNEGLQVHPMHLHGMPQFVIAKDGEPLDQPYAADTILVGPGERYTVLVNAKVPGIWVWHCHILNHVESSSGMFGMVTALIVEDPNAADADTSETADTTADTADTADTSDAAGTADTTADTSDTGA